MPIWIKFIDLCRFQEPLQPEAFSYPSSKKTPEQTFNTDGLTLEVDIDLADTKARMAQAGRRRRKQAGRCPILPGQWAQIIIASSDFATGMS